MRLIDADLLRAEFTGNFSETWHYTGIWAMINNAPTAYDIDKVVEQLEEKRQKCDTDNYADEPSYDEGQYDAFTEAVEIVKGGKL